MPPRKASRFSDDRLEKMELLTRDIHIAVMGGEGVDGIFKMVKIQNGRVSKLEALTQKLSVGYLLGASVLVYIASQFSWRVKP